MDLPKATNLPTQTKPENITIAIDKQGDIYWNTKVLSGQDELKAKLRGIAREEPQPEVHIRGDANVRYQFVGQVLVATQQIGIRKVAFITDTRSFRSRNLGELHMAMSCRRERRGPIVFGHQHDAADRRHVGAPDHFHHHDSEHDARGEDRQSAAAAAELRRRRRRLRSST